MAGSTKINGKIEFLRFFFSIIIVIHHSRSFLGDDISPFLGGSLAVEFFFFVSGYLMMATIEKRNKIGAPDYVGMETAQYIIKKWCAVFPEASISWTIAFAVMVIAKKPSLRSIIVKFIDTVWELLFITMTGLGQRGINGVVWYISAMLICMAILYPLLRKHHDITIHLIIPFASLCIFGYMFKNHGSLRDPTKWLGWTYKGVLRAFAEIGIGCLLYYLSNVIRTIRFNTVGRWLVTLTENIFYIAVTYFMYLMGSNKHDYFFIALMAFAVALTFSGSGIDMRLFNNKVILWLGRLSVPLYFSHTFWASHLNYYVSTDYSIPLRLLIYLGVSFATTFVVMYLAKGLRSITPVLINKFKKVIFEQ